MQIDSSLKRWAKKKMQLILQRVFEEKVNLSSDLTDTEKKKEKKETQFSTNPHMKSSRCDQVTFGNHKVHTVP